MERALHSLPLHSSDLFLLSKKQILFLEEGRTMQTVFKGCKKGWVFLLSNLLGSVNIFITRCQAALSPLTIQPLLGRSEQQVLHKSKNNERSLQDFGLSLI